MVKNIYNVDVLKEIDKKLRKYGYMRIRSGEYQIPSSFRGFLSQRFKNAFPRLIITTDLIQENGKYKVCVWFDLRISAGRWLNEIIKQRFKVDVHDLDDDSAKKIASKLDRSYRNKKAGLRTIYGFSYGTITEITTGDSRKVRLPSGVSLYEALLSRFKEKHPDVEIMKIDAAKNQDFIVQAGIRSVPTTLVFVDGELKHAYTGAKPPERIEEEIRKAESE